MNESQKTSLIPEADPLPDALFGGADLLEDDADFESFWSRFLPDDIQFFNFSMMDQFVRRPFHAVMIEGPFDLPRLVLDHRTSLYRSETILSRKGKPQIDRLLLACGDGVFGYYEGERLKVYGPTRKPQR